MHAPAAACFVPTEGPVMLIHQMLCRGPLTRWRSEGHLDILDSPG